MSTYAIVTTTKPRLFLAEGDVWTDDRLQAQELTYREVLHALGRLPIGTDAAPFPFETR